MREFLIAGHVREANNDISKLCGVPCKPHLERATQAENPFAPQSAGPGNSVCMSERIWATSVCGHGHAHALGDTHLTVRIGVNYQWRQP
jgi:hypothetical protein